MTDPDTNTAPPSDIQSRPRYGILEAVPHSQWNLIVAEDQAIDSVLRMLDEAPKGFNARVHLLLVVTDAEADEEECLNKLDNYGPISVDIASTAQEGLDTLNRLLEPAKMGTRLYTAGSESFLGQVVHIAMQHHINHESVITELNGSLARRVQCVHCKFTTEGVTTSFYDCPECGLTLLVRDHYSRRLAAYQGVSATAEDPDVRIDVEVVYP